MKSSFPKTNSWCNRSINRARALVVCGFAAGVLAVSIATPSCRRMGAGSGADYVPIQATPAPTPISPPPPTPSAAAAPEEAAPPATADGETRPGNPAAWGEAASAMVGRTFDPVYFEFDSAELDTVARGRLTEYAQWLKGRPDVWLTLEGHTDSTGSLRYNYNLGMARAQAVFDMLRTLGVDAGRMFCISYGEDRLAVDETDPAAMALNRRVEILGFVAPPGVTQPQPVPVTDKTPPQAAEPEPAAPAPAADIPGPGS